MNLEKGDYEKVRDDMKDQVRIQTLNKELNEMVLEWLNKKIKEKE